jgi:hypothetical protein
MIAPGRCKRSTKPTLADRLGRPLRARTRHPNKRRPPPHRPRVPLRTNRRRQVALPEGTIKSSAHSKAPSTTPLARDAAPTLITSSIRCSPKRMAPPGGSTPTTAARSTAITGAGAAPSHSRRRIAQPSPVTPRVLRPSPEPASRTLNITGGTASFKGAAGECLLDNHLRDVQFGVQEQYGTFSWTIST